MGSDHAGFELKEQIETYLIAQGFPVTDFGADNTDSVDYPDIAFKVADEVASGSHGRGILVCHTGVGMSIAANKVPGVRAALCSNVYCAAMSREHNDTNVLALGASTVTPDEANEIVRVWLSTEFSHGERHQRRIGKITMRDGG